MNERSSGNENKAELTCFSDGLGHIRAGRGNPSIIVLLLSLLSWQMGKSKAIYLFYDVAGYL